MEFALGMPGLILYPPIVSPWESGASPADILRVAKTADRVGWDWLTVSEHLVIPREMADVMGPRFPEAVSAAAVLAGATERIKLLTYVLVLPYRNPVLLAKQISTLDFLSGGRIILGTAVGHMVREFQVLKVPFEERGAMTDEYLRAMVELWTSPDPSFQGRYVQFKDVVFEPKPVQKPYPPILVGGNSLPAMRRAAALGDGWLPWLVIREGLPGCLSYIREQPGFEQRRERFEVVMPVSSLNVADYSHEIRGETHLLSSREELLEEIGLLAEAGVTVVQVPPPRTASVEQLLEWIEWFAAEIMPCSRE